jgi:hypothetical protein
MKFLKKSSISQKRLNLIKNFSMLTIPIAMISLKAQLEEAEAAEEVVVETTIIEEEPINEIVPRFEINQSSCRRI